MIRVTSDWSDVENELDRLSSQPSAATAARLRAVLDTGFATTQAAVHRETGALAASGKVEDSKDRIADQWEGTITYGDDSGPVDYAIYEKRRGAHWAGASSVKGDHDFFRGLKALHALWLAAVRDGLSK